MRSNKWWKYVNPFVYWNFFNPIIPPRLNFVKSIFLYHLYSFRLHVRARKLRLSLYKSAQLAKHPSKKHRSYRVTVTLQKDRMISSTWGTRRGKYLNVISGSECLENFLIRWAKSYWWLYNSLQRSEKEITLVCT